MIEGVEIKDLVTHSDERGFFREMIRVSDSFFGEGSFGQLSHSLMHPGSGKGWHYHPNQTDWWYAIGSLKVALYDLRPASPTNQTAGVASTWAPPATARPANSGPNGMPPNMMAMLTPDTRAIRCAGTRW